VCNISDPNQVTAAFDRTVTLLGKVDSVFSNAGVGGPIRPFVDLTLAEWNQVLDINLSGTFLTLQAGARHLVERGEGGALIAVSSTAAIHGAPRHEAYAASKTAILGLTRSLAVGLAQSRIRVNALLPGWTDTGMLDNARSWKTFVNNTTKRTPAGRWADPTEYGRVAVYLADPSLTFHTGDTVVVDGGYTIF
jgi:NAD(P)-dependent dehydrogenase (short-subunit alcohol dehydrogenase family)